VIGHVATTIHPIYLDTTLFKRRIAPYQVGFFGTSPKGEGVGVLKEQQSRWYLTSCDLTSKLYL
jgi:hypothetical protein